MASAYGAASGDAAAAGLETARNTSRKFDEGRNFANKLWNAARFALRRLDAGGAAPPRRAAAPESLLDRWIVSRLHGTCRAVDRAIAEYQFNAVAEAMYDFVWRDFCDWYVEGIKPTVDGSPGQQQVLRTVLDAALRLLHPLCPFVTEALWPHVSAAGRAGLPGVTLGPPRGGVLASAPWPEIDESAADPGAESLMGRLQELVKAIRNLRTEHNVPPRSRLTLAAGGDALDLVRAGGAMVESLAGIERVVEDGAAPAGATAVPFEGGHLYVAGLAGAVDPEVERGRLLRQREAQAREVERYRARLGNESYLSKAPAAVVEDTRKRLAAAVADLEAADRALALLGKE
jgi:valyl-tRNA synthetase